MLYIPTLHMDPESLIAFLVKRELGGQISVQEVVSDFEASGLEALEFLEASGFGEREKILRLVADEQGRQFIDLDAVVMPVHLISAIDPDIRRIFGCLPLEVSNDAAKVCLVDPFDDVALKELVAILGKKVEVAIADPEKIESRLAAFAEGRFDAPQPMLVPASTTLGPHTTPAKDAGKSLLFSSTFLLVLVVLAVLVTASAVLYLSQSKRMEDWGALFKKYEESARQSDAMQHGVDVTLRQLEGKLGAFDKLITAKEIDANRITSLDEELKELRGKLDSLDKILTKAGEKQAKGNVLPDMKPEQR